MQMPRPTRYHQKLEALAGRWSGEEKMFPTPWDPEGGTARGEMKSRIDMDGFGLVQEYVQKRKGKVSYRGHGVVGYCPDEKTYLWHWSDSMGGVPSSVTRGTWKGSKLVFQSAHAMGHSRYTYTFHRDGTLGFSIENSQNGNDWAMFMTARYAKK